MIMAFLREINSLEINCFFINFHIHTVHIGTIKVFHSPTNAQLNCLKNNFKIDIKIDIKTAPTCFGAITIIRERIIRSAEVTFVKIN
jgi:hypothetical protein